MRLLALADSDDFRWRGPNTPVDVLVSCGDVCDELILDAARCCAAAQILAVKGNHDGAGPFPAPIIDVHLQVVTLPGGCRIAGFNGCWRYKPQGHFLYGQAEAIELMRDLPPVDVLIAHNSPQEIHEADEDVHQGFAALLEYIRRHSPRLLLHGHQHVRCETEVDGTRVVGVFGHAFLDL
jgi:predicted phosphodiesterase